MESIEIVDRKDIKITNATKVISSTNTQAVVEVADSNIIISGNNIEVTKLDLENKEVQFKGEIAGIKYAHKTEKVNIIKRLFK
ncbi:MAG: YabP/YqfC family sporulation protein [Candidatus Caccovivens sp.]